MSKPPNRPAFPTVRAGQGYGEDGMTLRDYFAAAALTGFFTVSNELHKINGGKITKEDLATTAYQVADAMLAERAKP